MEPFEYLSLRMHSGVPIVEVRGDWVPGIAEALAEAVRALAGAGHLEIIVNLQRASCEAAAVLRALGAVAHHVRARHGRVTVVGTPAQVARLSTLPLGIPISLAASETGALGAIKGVPVHTAGPFASAQIAFGAVRP